MLSLAEPYSSAGWRSSSLGCETVFNKCDVTMKRSITLVLFAMLIGLLLVSGCSGAPQRPEGVLTPDELLDNPVYNKQIRVYGKVSGLGEVMCPCFFLRTGEKTLHVWYDLMVEDDGMERPAVSVAEFDNRDWVIVTGELKPAGQHYSLNDFWASGFEVMR